eukprot:TRINITY_DN1462_c0_g1_i1.p1 TRINITY_DN1462_c0_g1~~TRINITY_DN1462_c0_g1_i1.p1  ORF type:complete len:1032 (-),score=235.43 TRINITY_DN1462_c0_g1_i1:78-2807(-)
MKVRQKEAMSFLSTPRPPPDAQTQLTFMNRVYTPTLVAGAKRYVVSCRWFKTWQNFLQDRSDLPDRIDNVSLLREGSMIQLKPDLVEGRDFLTLPERAWELLHSWYGGGPALSRTVIDTGGGEQVEAYPLTLWVVMKKDGEEKIRVINISRAATVRDLKRRACALFDVPVDQHILWNYFNNKRESALLNLAANLDLAGLVDSQHILIGRKRESLVEVTQATTGYTGYVVRGSLRADVTPGCTGLYNMGNTCFMAAALQCVGNTPGLLDQFLSDAYISDINTTNTFGHKGEIATQFASLMKALWAGNAKYLIPRDFRRAFTMACKAFAGYQQHDSHDFLYNLLDALHEDLNRVPKKPYVENVDATPNTLIESGQEQWKRCLLRDNSIVRDAFAGLTRSELSCPECDKVSITFEVCHSIELPLPIPKTRAIPLVFYFADGTTPIKMAIELPRASRVGDLLRKLSEITRTQNDDLLAFVMWDHKFSYQFKAQETLDSIRPDDDVVVFELQYDVGGQIIHLFQRKYDPRAYLSFALIADTQLVHVPRARARSVGEMKRILAEQLKRFVPSNTVDEVLTCVEFRLVNSSGGVVMKDLNNDLDAWESTTRVYVTADWKADALQRIGTKPFSELLAHESVKLLEIVKPVRLEECLQMFSTPEQLGEKNMWYCAKCQDHRDARKTLELWKLPEVLVITLKRFTHSGSISEKLSMDVVFPITGLDMSQFEFGPHEHQPVYDLYAVVNHIGVAGGGHYTAYCRNRVDNNWYYYDDTDVVRVEAQAVQTPAAYVLFYRRRDAAAPAPLSEVIKAVPAPIQAAILDSDDEDAAEAAAAAAAFEKRRQEEEAKLAKRQEIAAKVEAAKAQRAKEELAAKRASNTNVDTRSVDDLVSLIEGTKLSSSTAGGGGAGKKQRKKGK